MLRQNDLSNQFDGLCHFYLFLLNINHGIKNEG